MIFGEYEKESEGSDVDDIVLIAIALVAVICILIAAYFIAKKLSPKIRDNIEAVL